MTFRSAAVLCDQVRSFLKGEVMNGHHMLLAVARLRVLLVAHPALKRLVLVVLSEVVLDVAGLLELVLALGDHAFVNNLSVPCGWIHTVEDFEPLAGNISEWVARPESRLYGFSLT